MASPFPSTFPNSIHSPTARKPDPIRAKATPSPSGWWSPIFGWGSEPDYITKPGSDAEPVGPGGPRSRFAPGCFTEDKARELRRKTRETATFHDIMYHSAIASRLASDVSD